MRKIARAVASAKNATVSMIIFPIVSIFFLCHLCLGLSFEKTGRTALHCAAHNGNTSVAQLLLANGAKVDETDGEGVQPEQISKKMVFFATEDLCIDKLRLKWKKKCLGV